MPSTLGLSEERAELEAVYASGIFSRAPGLAQMLNYVCTKYFEGQSDRVKEYSIAVEALGRPPDFDQKRDSIVRVEAHRLRKRLSEYYDREGASHAIRIVLPSGQYVPRFLAVEPQEVLETTSATEILTAVPLVLEPRYAPPARPPVRRPFLWLAGLIAACGIVYVATRSPLRPAGISA